MVTLGFSRWKQYNWHKIQAVHYLFKDLRFRTEVSDDINHFQHRNTSSLPCERQKNSDGGCKPKPLFQIIPIKNDLLIIMWIFTACSKLIGLDWSYYVKKRKEETRLPETVLLKKREKLQAELASCLRIRKSETIPWFQHERICCEYWEFMNTD